MRWLFIPSCGAAATILSLSCGEGRVSDPAVGTLEVTVETSGADAPQGFRIAVDGGRLLAIDAGGTIVLADVPPGPRTVTLVDIPANCAVEGANPLGVDVPPAGRVLAAFAVACQAVTGALEVTVTTEGEDPDPEGYVLLLNGAAAGPLAPADTVLVEGLDPGEYEVGIDEVAANCGVAEPNPRPVTVAAGDTARVAFRVECEAVGEGG